MNAYKPTFLILSKKNTLALWLKKHLEKKTFLIFEKDSEKALERALQTKIDFLILEENFIEEEKLFSFIQSMKKAVKSPFTPFLLITKKLKKAYQKEALLAGITDFLSDPLEKKDLWEKIQTASKTKKLEEKIKNIQEKFTQEKQKKIEQIFTYKLAKEPSKIEQKAYLALIQIDHFEKLDIFFPKEKKEKIFLLISQMITSQIKEKTPLILAEEGKFLLIFRDKEEKEIKEWVKALKEKASAFPLEEEFPLSFSVIINLIKDTENTPLVHKIFQKTFSKNQKELQKGEENFFFLS